MPAWGAASARLKNSATKQNRKNEPNGLRTDLGSTYIPSIINVNNYILHRRKVGLY
jgi:hypothetical protein